jgi:hypothetical protein
VAPLCIWCWTRKPTSRRSSLIRCPVDIDALRAVPLTLPMAEPRDLTAEIARKVLSRAVESDRELPAAVRDFVERAGA